VDAALLDDEYPLAQGGDRVQLVDGQLVERPVVPVHRYIVPDVRNVCVYLSSSDGVPAHVAAIEALANEIARRKLVLVYGGAQRGLMGVLADAALAAGAEVVGVIPRALVDLEIAHTGLTELNVVDTM